MPDRKITPNQKIQVRERAKACCEYCRSQEMFATESFSVDHIIPRVNDGKTELTNLAYACLGCNAHKYTHTLAEDPATNEITPLFNPRKQKWLEHFVWNDDFTEIIGTTPTARTTVSMLKLNRDNLINLRRLLLMIDKHPPPF